MDRLQHRTGAVIICLIMIALASVLGAGITLREMREQSAASFQLPEFQQDIVDLSGECANIISISRNYLPDDHEDVLQVRQRQDELSRAQSPREKGRAVNELVDATHRLHGTLRGQSGFTDADNDIAHARMLDIDQRQATIARYNPYNQNAAYFNRELSRFPANILGPVAGVRPLELYE